MNNKIQSLYSRLDQKEEKHEQEMKRIIQRDEEEIDRLKEGLSKSTNKPKGER